MANNAGVGTRENEWTSAPKLIEKALKDFRASMRIERWMKYYFAFNDFTSSTSLDTVLDGLFDSGNDKGVLIMCIVLAVGIIFISDE